MAAGAAVDWAASEQIKAFERAYRYSDKAKFPDKRRKAAKKMKEAIEYLKSNKLDKAKDSMKDFVEEASDIPDYSDLIDAINGCAAIQG